MGKALEVLGKFNPEFPLGNYVDSFVRIVGDTISQLLELLDGQNVGNTYTN